MSPARDAESAEDLAYFRTLEAVFLDLRGAPLLLSPADYQVARRWRREGIPLDVVVEALRELFERRRQRGAERRVNSLRYCRPAVQRAWRRVAELRATGGRGQPEAIDTGRRLAALAESLPEELAGAGELGRSIVALDGPVEAVERGLAALDRELLESARKGLNRDDERAIAAAVAERLAELAERLGADQLEELGRRLELRELRRRLGLPMLSLFSPDAQP